MSFVKTGDEIEIEDIFNDNGKAQYCPECGKKLRLLSIADDENKLVCDCTLEIPEQLN